MTRQLVKSNTSTVWSPAWKYKMRWASVLPRFCSLVSPLSRSPAKGYKWLTHPTSAALQPSLTAFCKKRKCPGCIRDTQEKENMWPAGLWARGQPGLHGSFGTARDTQEYHVSKNWNQSHHHLPFSPCKWITSFCSLGMQEKGSQHWAQWGCRGASVPGVKFPCTLAKGIIFVSWPKYSNSISIHSLEMATDSNRALSVSHDSPVGSDFTVRKYFMVKTSPPRETWICPVPVSHDFSSWLSKLEES